MNASVGCLLSILISFHIIVAYICIAFLYACIQTLPSLYLCLHQNMPAMQVLYYPFHDDGAPHATAITDTTQARPVRLCTSQYCYHTYVSAPAILVA